MNAVAPPATFSSDLELVDLRELRAADLEPLWTEEHVAWRERLRWDFGPTYAILRHRVDARTLEGRVALVRGSPVGYCVIARRDDLGRVGNLFVSPAHRDCGLLASLLGDAVRVLRDDGSIARIEALAPSFDEAMPEVVGDALRVRARELMVTIGARRARVAPTPDVTIEPWAPGDLVAAADLAVDAFRGSADAELHRHLRAATSYGAHVVDLICQPLNGVFVPDASFTARAIGSRAPLGFVLSTRVSPTAGHVAELVVARSAWGRGVGAALLGASLHGLARGGCAETTLVVTSDNVGARRLYRRFGFETTTRLVGAAWERDALP